MTDAYEPAGFCPRCGYRLDHGPCPECGATFEHAARVSPQSRRARLRRIARVAVVLLCASVPLYFAALPAAYRWWPASNLYALARGRGWAASTAKDIMHWRRERGSAEALRRLEKVRAELGQTAFPDRWAAHPWAGSYSYSSVDEDVSFVLAPQTGFVYVQPFESAEVRLVYFYSFGSVRELGPGRLRLICEGNGYPLTVDDSGFNGEWQIVPWEGETWIVPAEELRKFALSSNSGLSGAGFVRRGADHPGQFGGRMHRGLPELPDEYACFLLPAPVICTLTAIDTATSRSYVSGRLASVCGTVDAGRREGLVPGIYLYANERLPYFIEVQTVSEVSGSVRLFGEGFRPDTVRVGLRLSTRNLLLEEPQQGSRPTTAPAEQEPARSREP
jgi:hypothetical protein